MRGVLLLVVAGLVAVPAAAQAPKVLATVGDEIITDEDLRAAMLRRADGRPDQYADPAARRAVLDELVRERALVAAARAAGYAEDPRVVAVLESLMVERLRQDRIEATLAGIEVTPEEVATHYREHAAEYARPARSRAALIELKVPVGATPVVRAAVRQRAEEALAAARELDPSVTHFDTVAVRYSEDQASRYRGGVVGWLIRHQGRAYRWDPAVVEAVFALSEPGQIGPIVETANAFYLVRLVEREEVRERPLAAIEDGLRYSLLQERRQTASRALEAALVAGVPVQVDEAALAEVEPPVVTSVQPQETAPPALPER